MFNCNREPNITLLLRPPRFSETHKPNPVMFVEIKSGPYAKRGANIGGPFLRDCLKYSIHISIEIVLLTALKE